MTSERPLQLMTPNYIWQLCWLCGIIMSIYPPLWSRLHMGWIVMQCCTNIHSPQRLNPHGDPLIFFPLSTLSTSCILKTTLTFLSPPLYFPLDVSFLLTALWVFTALVVFNEMFWQLFNGLTLTMVYTLMFPSDWLIITLIILSFLIYHHYRPCLMTIHLQH